MNSEGDALMKKLNDNTKAEESSGLEDLLIFIKYIIFAGIATLVDLGILYLLTTYLFIHYLISAIFSYLCGMITNYSLNKYLTFKNRNKRYIVQFGIFAVVALIGLGLNELILFIFTDFFDLWYVYSKFISIGIVMIWSFFGHKHLTFSLLEKDDA
jgi:putative flippase GtrA